MEINTYSEWLGFGLVAILLVVLFVGWVLVKGRGIVARDKAAEFASEASGLDAEAMTPDAPAEPGDGDLGATTDLPTGIVGGGLSWYGKNEGVMSEHMGYGGSHDRKAKLGFLGVQKDSRKRKTKKG